MDYAALHKDWIEGRLYPWLRERFGKKDEADLDRDFGKLIQGMDLPEVIRWPSSAGDARRWCWSDVYFLLEQDEDLLLMSDGYLDVLFLEIKKGCTKADYAYAVAIHHMRDSSHQALSSDLQARLIEMQKWRSWFEHCCTQDTSYPLRLLSYVEQSKVTAEGAIQRVHDLRRCSPDYDKPPELKPHPKGWTCNVGSSYEAEKAMFIERKTGRMSLLG